MNTAILRDLVICAAAAAAELAGCYAFWRWQRWQDPLWVIAPGIVSLMVFAFLLTKVESPLPARVYAAYGGIYIAMSFVWLAIAQGMRPSLYDILGTVLALLGSIVIFLGPRLG